MLTWTTISNVQPGNQIAFNPDWLPAMRNEDLKGSRWLTVAATRIEGRSRIITFEDGTEFDAGHAYRLWVLTGE